MIKNEYLNRYLKCNPNVREDAIKNVESFCNDNILLIEFTNGTKMLYDPFTNFKRRYFKNVQNNFCFILKTILLHKNISQKELAMRMNVDENIVNRFVNGKQLPDYINLHKISEAIGCDINDLYF